MAQKSIIRDITVNYAKVYEPEHNERFNKTAFDIQLEFGKKRIKELEMFGNPRPLPNGNLAINISRNHQNKDGRVSSITVLDAAKNPFDKPIGNGSKANLLVLTYPQAQAKTKANLGMKTVLLAVQITEHVEYAPTGDYSSDFDVVESTSNTSEHASDF
jgi:hypothetical protein